MIVAEGEQTRVHAIEIIPARVGTFDKIVTLPVRDGNIEADSEQDVLKAVVFERHKRTGTAGKGFVKGFGIKRGALAQTVAHDAHNLLVVGSTLPSPFMTMALIPLACLPETRLTNRGFVDYKTFEFIDFVVK